MKQSTFTDMMIRIQQLRRKIDDANRALACGTMASLTRLPEEISVITEMVQDLPKNRRHQAIIALNTLDDDINSYTRILGMWQHQIQEDSARAC